MHAHTRTRTYAQTRKQTDQFPLLREHISCKTPTSPPQSASVTPCPVHSHTHAHTHTHTHTGNQVYLLRERIGCICRQALRKAHQSLNVQPLSALVAIQHFTQQGPGARGIVVEEAPACVFASVSLVFAKEGTRCQSNNSIQKLHVAKKARHFKGHKYWASYEWHQSICFQSNSCIYTHIGVDAAYTYTLILPPTH